MPPTHAPSSATHCPVLGSQHALPAQVLPAQHVSPGSPHGTVVVLLLVVVVEVVVVVDDVVVVVVVDDEVEVLLEEVEVVEEVDVVDELEVVDDVEVVEDVDVVDELDVVDDVDVVVVVGSTHAHRPLPLPCSWSSAQSSWRSANSSGPSGASTNGLTRTSKPPPAARSTCDAHARNVGCSVTLVGSQKKRGGPKGLNGFGAVSIRPDTSLITPSFGGRLVSGFAVSVRRTERLRTPFGVTRQPQHSVSCSSKLKT
jgi:hypothetical protein